jgi:hypothetical protein
MTKIYYDKWEGGTKVSDGMTEMARDESAARWDELRNRVWDKADGALAKQVGGQHYKDMKIQPVEFITANNLSFLEGNVVKYICRHHAKNGADDVRKAIHYCELILKTVYNE